MGEDETTPWPWPHRADSIVFDTVYTPLETRLIKEAQMAHATTICGLSMFIGQAVQQYQRFTGIDAPETLMQRLALERLSGGHQTKHLKHTTATIRQNSGSGRRRIGPGRSGGTRTRSPNTPSLADAPRMAAEVPAAPRPGRNERSSRRRRRAELEALRY